MPLTRREFLRYAATGTGIAIYAASSDTTFAAVAPGPEVFRLRILHTNDHHARIEPVDGSGGPLHGGVARRWHRIQKVRQSKRGRNLLLLDAGDVFQGTLWFNLYDGLADLEFYNTMGYDAMAVGNHEFDRGQATLAAFAGQARFPLLSANMVVDATSPLHGLVHPYITRRIDNEWIAIFGLTPEDTGILSNAGSGVTFTPPIEAAKRVVAELKGKGIDKIIALTHVGIHVDRQIAAEVAGISVIIGGHSHTPMGPMVSPPDAARPYPELVANPEGLPVVIATAWEWGRWLGDIAIGFDRRSRVVTVDGPTIELLADMESDAGFESRITELKAPISELLAREIGTAAELLDGARANVRTRETNLGNLVADAMLGRARNDGAQLAITNGGGIRASIDSGTVTVGEVLSVLPFGNTLARVDMSGAQVLAALENGVSQAETGAGRFPQVAGLRFSWDPGAAAGARVTAVHVAGAEGFTPLDVAATYRVVTNNFMLTGGDGYRSVAAGQHAIDLGYILADVVADYIAANSPVSVAVDGRIIEGASLSEPAAVRP